MRARIYHGLKATARDKSCERCCRLGPLTCCIGCRCSCTKTVDGVITYRRIKCHIQCTQRPGESSSSPPRAVNSITRRLEASERSAQRTFKDMGEMSIAKFLLVLGMVAGFHQASTNCKNCVNMGKEERAMFRAHSDACSQSSRAAPAQLLALGRGARADSPQLRAHVYCVLLRCKLVGKDGKLQKSAVLGQLAMRSDGKNITKILESCADQQNGDTPEDMAWSLFRCGFDKKAMLFDYMPMPSDSPATA